eukprot:16451620-Heterocapsa_arctica.AAC.1
MKCIRVKAPKSNFLNVETGRSRGGSQGGSALCTVTYDCLELEMACTGFHNFRGDCQQTNVNRLLGRDYMERMAKRV